MHHKNQTTNTHFSTCSVVMSIYKNDKPEWARSAIESMLSQSLASDDIILIKDGPVSPAIELILNGYEKFPNIRVVRFKDNIGAGAARNFGIALANNELVAIMDADDISVPDRLQSQVSAFNFNPQLSIVGGQIAEFEKNTDNIVSYRNVPITHKEIVSFSKRRSPFNNMSVCFRKSHIMSVGGYKHSTRAEDYNLWLELLSTDKLALNLPQILCLVRVDQASFRRRVTYEHTSELFKLRYKYLRRGYISITDLLIANSASILMLTLPGVLTKLIYKKVLRT